MRIHPQRIGAIVQLLLDTSVDATLPVDDSNPLRQVIINTHSPVVVQQVPEESLLVAELVPWRDSSGVTSMLALSGLDGIWRTKPL